MKILNSSVKLEIGPLVFGFFLYLSCSLNIHIFVWTDKGHGSLLLAKSFSGIRITDSIHKLTVQRFSYLFDEV